MNRIWVVFRKEIIDGVRDRRSLLALLLFPLFGPLVVSFAFTKAVDQDSVSRDLRLPVVGREHAPSLMRFLETKGVELVDGPSDVTDAVLSRRESIVLVIPEDYGKRVRSGRTAHVELVIDQSRTDTLMAGRHVRTLVEAHAHALGRLRLLARGVSPEVGEPIEVRSVDLSTPRQRAAIFLNVIPMFVLLAAFFGSMQLAADATAGERERGSLEPLLITPVTRRALLLGKWLATVAFSASALVATLFSTLFALSRVPAEKLGLSFVLAPLDMLLVLLAALPLALMFPAAQILLASFARSVKEAQTYMSLGIFMPMVPAMLTSFEVLPATRWLYPIPVLGQQLLLNALVRGEDIDVGVFMVATTSALVVALLCVRAAAALMRRESIVFGR